MPARHRRRQSQFEYYAALNLFPSTTSLKSTAALKKYESIRRNLYDRHLHVPLALLANHHVLDLGCGTGESALVIARASAKLTLVDADARVWKPLKSSFGAAGVARQIISTETRSAEDYRPDRRFTFIMAEGFLFTCAGRERIARRLAAALEADGFLSISFPDEIGSFMEMAKKAAFLRACALEGVADLFGAHAEQIGRALLGAAHKALPNSRPFRTWLHDTVCSPFLQHRFCWSAPAILRAVAREGAVYHSSSPSIYEVDRLGWYKQVTDDRSWTTAALAGYERRAADFAFGRPVTFADPRAAASFAAATRALLRSWTPWFQRPRRALPAPQARWYAALETSDLPVHTSAQLRAFVAAFNETSQPHFLRAIARAPEILSTWGKSYHYLVVRRARPPRTRR
jgi:SAM-dependent methyltransferase